MIKQPQRTKKIVPKNMCKECDGKGRWFDASHSCSRMCTACNGTGRSRTKQIVTK